MGKSSTSFYKGQVLSKEIRDKISKTKKGVRFSDEHKRRISISNIGKHHTEETKKKISIANKGKKGTLGKHWKLPKGSNSGCKNPAWKGGITNINNGVRTGNDYKYWRKCCVIRYNFTCRKCFLSGRKIEVHHINNFSDFPELRLAIDNGITFCKECHIKFHIIYGRKNNTMSQLVEFLQN